MKERRNISMESRVHEMAREVMAKRGHRDLSGFIEELIRTEYDRRFPPAPSVNERSPAYQIAPHDSAAIKRAEEMTPPLPVAKETLQKIAEILACTTLE
jgi:hypothetical protein